MSGQSLENQDRSAVRDKHDSIEKNACKATNGESQEC